jgi:hypothetical protein
VEPQVKVESAAVDMVTGKAPASPVGAAETRVVQALGIFFFVLLTEGLVLAGSVSEGGGEGPGVCGGGFSGCRRLPVGWSGDGVQGRGFAADRGAGPAVLAGWVSICRH